MFRLSKPGLSKTATFSFGLFCVLAGPAAFGQASSGSPNTADSQVAFSFTTSLSSPRGVAVAPDGTIYVADSAKKYVVRITPAAGGYVSPTGGTGGTLSSTSATVSTTGVTLTGPTAVAVDAQGDLFIADGGTRLIKVTTPEGTGAGAVITYATGTVHALNPVSLAVDPTTNDLYIGDSANHAVYDLPNPHTATGGATALALDSTAAKPVGLAADTNSNLYYADANNNTVYKRTSGVNGTNSVYLSIPAGNDYSLEFSSATALPIGMGFDPAGNLYVMDSGSYVGGSYPYNSAAPGNLYEIPAANDFYLAPTSNIGGGYHPPPYSAPAGIALDSVGNILLVDDTNNALDKLFYNNPLNFGTVDAGAKTAEITANFQFNTGETGIASYQSVQGDYTGEFTQDGSNCPGTAESTCTVQYYATYLATTPGLRAGVFGFTAGSVLAVNVNAIDVAGALALYPGTQVTVSQSTTALHEPQGLAITGNGGNLFVADEGIDYNTYPATYPYAAVYQYTVSSGAISSKPTSIGKFPTPLTVEPLAVALDAAGDLYVADYGGEIYVVQPALTISGSGSNKTYTMSWPGSAKLLTLTGVTLYHPMTLAFDPSGNLFIGDMGSAGVLADKSTPGFIVEVPSGPLACGASSCTIGGPSAFVLTNTTGILFPQSLVTDSTGDLFIADGGDGDTDLGGVDVLTTPVSTGTPAPLSLGNLSQPSGLSMDAAGDLYIVDAYNGRVVVANLTETNGVFTVNGNVEVLGETQSGNGASGLTSPLVTPSSSVVWPGGQNITIADLGYPGSAGGSANPVQILTLEPFNSTAINVSKTATGSVNVLNTGNTEITFTAPTISTNFSMTGGCGGSSGDTLNYGVKNTCAATLAYSSSSASSNKTIKLNGNTTTHTDYSSLGNVINVNGLASGSAATLTAPNMTYNTSVTATLTNTGSSTLTIKTIAISDSVKNIGGTCAVNGTLATTKSCTITYTFTKPFTSATVTVTTNPSTGTLTASTFYITSSNYPSAGVLQETPFFNQGNGNNARTSEKTVKSQGRRF